MTDKERQAYIEEQKALFEARQASQSKKTFSQRVKESLRFRKYAKHLVENKPTIWKNPNNKPLNLKGKKIAIYTCVTGGYDSIKEPVFINDKIDYFIFTDNDNFSSKIWKVK